MKQKHRKFSTMRGWTRPEKCLVEYHSSTNFHAFHLSFFSLLCTARNVSHCQLKVKMWLLIKPCECLKSWKLNEQMLKIDCTYISKYYVLLASVKGCKGTKICQLQVKEKEIGVWRHPKKALALEKGTLSSVQWCSSTERGRNWISSSLDHGIIDLVLEESSEAT